MRKQLQVWLPILLVCFATVAASAQSFRVQCPTTTVTHRTAANNNSEPTFVGPTYSGLRAYPANPNNVNGAIKCQQISGGDGYATMGDGTQTYMFSFGPLSGLAKIAAGQPGTDFPSEFNQPYSGPMLQPGEPATTDDPSQNRTINLANFKYNGAIGLVPDLDANRSVPVFLIIEAAPPSHTVTALAINPPVSVGSTIVVSGVTPAGFNGTFQVTARTPFSFSYTVTATGLGFGNLTNASVATLPIDGHVDPQQVMNVGVMNGNIPAPLMALDEDDEYFLTLTNVGMIMRPDLFEQHTVHFHGYPNASAFYDGVPDASVAVNIGGSMTYYYLAPDAGTYFWHCHITPPEHLQMGMVGQIYVRPRQNRVVNNGSLLTALQTQNTDLRMACRRPLDGVLPAVQTAPDILCSNPVPAVTTSTVTGGFNTSTHQPTKLFAYNDGDGSTQYEVEYPLQIHGFDPNFHFVGMTFNPEAFAEMKDKYFLLNGRSYPDTVQTGPLETQATDGALHFSQPLPSIITIPHGGRALLRISDLDVTEYQTLASLGIPMKVIGLNAKLLRDQAGSNLYYSTNSITLGGGESIDVILDTCAVARAANGSCATPMAAGTYYLYTPNLDHLSNDAENFGGLMTEVRVQ